MHLIYFPFRIVAAKTFCKHIYILDNLYGQYALGFFLIVTIIFFFIMLVRYDDSFAVPCKQLCQRWSTSADNDLDQFDPSDLTSMAPLQVVECLGLLVEDVRMFQDVYVYFRNDKVY